MTELKIILIEFNKAIRTYLESGHAKKSEELRQVCYLADMFEKKFNEVYDRMYTELYGHAPTTPNQKNYSNAN
jgi:hypothetical protein